MKNQKNEIGNFNHQRMSNAGKRCVITYALLLCALINTVIAQSSAFTYQGRLDDGGSPANGVYDLSFTIYNAATDGTAVGSIVLVDDAIVSQGLFTVVLDFGVAPFNGDARWLEIAVRPGASVEDHTMLVPRQPITSTPYAIRAISADSVDSGTVNNPSFIGTTTPAPLQLAVNNQIALRLEDNGDGATDGDSISDGAPNVIGGASGNTADSGAVGVTISGGGAGNFYGSQAAKNVVAGDYGTVGGGLLQRIEAGAFAATIDGGYGNTIGGQAQQAAIGGGYFNSVGNLSHTAAIGGGYVNQIGANAAFAVIPGGEQNSVGNNAANAFAAGRRAKANHAGSFVWADTTDADFSSTGNNQFLIRASGGVGIGTSNPTEKLDVAGTVKATAFVGNGAGLTNLAVEMVPVSNGGTGASTAPEARTNLGLGSLSTMSPAGGASASTFLRGDNTWAATPNRIYLNCKAVRIGSATPTVRYYDPEGQKDGSGNTDQKYAFFRVPASGVLKEFTVFADNTFFPSRTFKVLRGYPGSAISTPLEISMNGTVQSGSSAGSVTLNAGEFITIEDNALGNAFSVTTIFYFTLTFEH